MAQAPAPIPAAVRIAANHVNVSAAARVTPEDFLAALIGDASSKAARGAFETYIDEADPGELADLVACGATTFEALVALAAAWLPPLLPNRVHIGQFTA